LANVPSSEEGHEEGLHDANARIEGLKWQRVLLQEMTNKPGSEEGHEDCLHGADASIEVFIWQTELLYDWQIYLAVRKDMRSVFTVQMPA
jgi:hypothetical protein